MKVYPYILIIGSAIGLIASFGLMLDTIKLFENPDAILLCNVNPFISCSSVIDTWQGYVFGFPNPLLGIIAFSMLLAVGVMLFSGGRAKKPLWLLVNLGTLASVVFVVWFIYESIWNLGTICIYCLTTWIVTWPIFLYTTIWNYRENHFKFEKLKSKYQGKIDTIGKNISDNHIHYLFVWYFLIAVLIVFKFKEYIF